MAISFVQHVTEAHNITPSTLTYPATTTGNLLAIIMSVKPYTRTTTPPVGLFDGGNDHGSSTGGLSPNGVDTGQMKISFWSRTVDGSEPVTSSLTWSTSAPGPVIQSALEFSKTAEGAWSVASAYGADSIQSTGTAAIDSTAASDPGYQSGDLVVIAFATPTDDGTYTNPAITVPGCIVSAVTHRVGYATALGNDAGLRVWSASIISGTSTAAPQFQCDVHNMNASAGVLLFARLREPGGGPVHASDALVYDGTAWTNTKVQSFDGTSWS